MREKTNSLRAVLPTIALACLLYSPPAGAALGDVCHAWTNAEMPWFQGPGILPVYVSNSASNNLNTALGLGTWDTDIAVQRALAIWNEEAGTSIKLKYMGQTSATSNRGAITIYGDSAAPCGEDESGAPAEARMSRRFVGFGIYIWSSSQVIMYRNAGDCQAYPWSVNNPADRQHDVVTVLVHELGHAVYNLGHPNDASYSDCAFPTPMVSVMGDPARNLGPMDLELAQTRVGVRAPYSRFYRNYLNGTWMSAWVAADAAGTTPLFRMGSIPQDVSVRALGFVDNGPGGTTVRDGGRGYFASFARYRQHTLNPWYYLAPPMPRPVALASKPSAGAGVPSDMIMAYQYNVHPAIYEVGHSGVICWKRSADGGQTWGAQTCNSSVTDVYGLSAAYDAGSNSFLITWVHTESGIYNRIMITRVPATGNTNNVFTTGLSISALHAPAIACTGVGSRCLLAYETTNGNGSLGGTFINVEDSFIFHRINIIASYTWSLVMFDTPGLAYVPTDNTFRIAITWNNASTYSYSMSNANPAAGWTGTGDIWNNTNTHVSSAVLSWQELSGVKRLGAWFVKYW